jgi:hypothetical protein
MEKQRYNDMVTQNKYLLEKTSKQTNWIIGMSIVILILLFHILQGGREIAAP